MNTQAHSAPAIRSATEDDLDAAADTLGLAFADYPWTNWVLPSEDHAERLREVQRLYLAHALQHGIVLVSGQNEGVIALLPSGAPAPSDDVITRVVELHGDRVGRLQLGGPDESAPEDSAAEGANIGVDRSVDRNAWSVETLGVRPEARGIGLGSALVAAALRLATERGASSFVLDTSEPLNVKLYERHGFTVSGHVPGGAYVGSAGDPATADASPDVWHMERSAASS